MRYLADRDRPPILPVMCEVDAAGRPVATLAPYLHGGEGWKPVGSTWR